MDAVIDGTAVLRDSGAWQLFLIPNVSPQQSAVWGRAAARCEFNDCNRLLYKSPVTQEPVNLAEMAHIYSFSKDGPRGWGIFTRTPLALNDVGNLMLVCHDCHKKIDQDKTGKRYSADLLRRWKGKHEARVRIATACSRHSARRA